MRFRITWREGAYYVDVPEYEGGEVVTARDYDNLDRVVADLHERVRGLRDDNRALRAALAKWEAHAGAGNLPAIGAAAWAARAGEAEIGDVR